MAAHFDINVIKLGADAFTSEQNSMVDEMVDRAEKIFSRYGLPIAAVGRYRISQEAAGSLALPRSESDLASIGRRWSIEGQAIDVFVVAAMAIDTVAGKSAISGSCSKSSKPRGVRTPVVSLRETPEESGVVLAHELGHFLGLFHCPLLCSGMTNVMEPVATANHREFTPGQVEVMTEHCIVKS